MGSNINISVVITVYNLEKFIQAALDSVLSQTVLPGQVIVVDDCSTDNSATIIQGYGSRITYVKMAANSGVLKATIEGIKQATGDIICFLDGDDVWMNTKLEETAGAFARSEEIMLVTHNYYCIDANGTAIDFGKDLQNKLSATINNAKSDDELSAALRSLILKNNYIVCLSSAYSVRKNYFDVQAFDTFCNATFSDEELRKTVQDLAVVDYLIATNTGKKIYAIDKKLYQYRISGSNTSGQANDLASALRALQRHKATTRVTAAMVQLQPQLKKENKFQKYLATEADYLSNLYQKKFGRSLIQFCKLAVHVWTTGQIVKEIKRFAAVLILGPAKFFKLKSR
jgi:glycosyltransferase involved in cell wall biosynthesis